MDDSSENEGANLCVIGSFIIAAVCSLVTVIYALKHVRGLVEGAWGQMSDDAMEYTVIGIALLLPMTGLGLLFAAFGRRSRRVAFIAQAVSVGLAIGLLAFYACW